jgi:hypothetical protein
LAIIDLLDIIALRFEREGPEGVERLRVTDQEEYLY